MSLRHSLACLYSCVILCMLTSGLYICSQRWRSKVFRPHRWCVHPAACWPNCSEKVHSSQRKLCWSRELSTRCNGMVLENTLWRPWWNIGRWYGTWKNETSNSDKHTAFDMWMYYHRAIGVFLIWYVCIWVILLFSIQVVVFILGLFHSQIIERALIVAPPTLLKPWEKEFIEQGLTANLRL